MTPTINAQRFMAANDQYKIIIGAALSDGGGILVLENKVSYKLTLEDCRSLPQEYPKWKLPAPKEQRQ